MKSVLWSVTLCCRQHSVKNLNFEDPLTVFKVFKLWDCCDRDGELPHDQYEDPQRYLDPQLLTTDRQQLTANRQELPPCASRLARD